MIPEVEISIGGRPVAGVGKRALSGQIVESDGERADELDLQISNYDGMLKKPRRDETVTVEVGWKETGVVKVGEYVVAETVKTGPRAEFHLAAHSADLKKTLKGQKTRSWKKPRKLGDVLRDVARDNGLEPAIDHDLAEIPIEKIIAQTGESDMHLVTRLARQYDALAKFASGRLVFVKRGAGTTASGAPAGSVTVTPNDCEGFSFVDRDRPARRKVKNIYYDRSNAKRNEVTSDKGLASSDAPDYVHPQIYGTQIEADKHANARKGDFDRAGRAFHATLGQGRVGVAPGGVVTTKGFHDDDDREWVVKRRVFGFSGGLIVRLDCEPKEE